MPWHEGMDATTCDKSAKKRVQAEKWMQRHTPLHATTCGAKNEVMLQHEGKHAEVCRENI